MRTLLLLVLSCTLLVAACATTPVDSGTLGAPDRIIAIDPSRLVLAPLDRIEIRVYGVDDITGEYRIDESGTVKMPLIGYVTAAGVRSNDFAEQLEVAYGEKYLNDPDIAVIVVERFAKEVTVEGAVREPGRVTFNGELTLLQAIAESGGLEGTANRRQVRVFRMVDGERRQAIYDLSAIYANKRGDPTLYGNDVVVVEGSAVRSSYRDIVLLSPLLGVLLR